jgi:hypothetical protein
VIGEKVAEHPQQLWKIRVTGGAPQDTGIRIPGFTQVYGLSLTPDGERLAFTLGQVSTEMCVMEHFLPASALASVGR